MPSPSETKTRPAADVSGRAYAFAAAVNAGDLLEADGGFTCIPDGKILTVQGDPGALFVACRCGGHAIDGQNDGNGVLVGFSSAERAKAVRS